MRFRLVASAALAAGLAAALPTSGVADTLLLKTPEVVYGKIVAETPLGYSVKVSCKGAPVSIARTEVVGDPIRNKQCGPVEWNAAAMKEFQITGTVNVLAMARSGSDDLLAFKFVDANHDGVLDKDELNNVIGARMPKTAYVAEKSNF